MKALAALTWLGLLSTQAAAQNPAAQLAGLWGAELNLGPTARGELLVRRYNRVWQVRLGDVQTRFTSKDGSVEFDLGGDVGRFRGRFTADSSAIQGHWIQARHFSNGYRYATPTRLNKSTTGYTATLTPLEDRVSIYLVVRARGDTVVSFIRNPEYNWGVERHAYVAMSGDRVTLTNMEDSSDVIRGRYDAAGQRLYLTMRELRGREVELTPRGRNDAVGFHTRTPVPERYHYRQPAARNDGWRTASLGEVKLDTALIDSLVRQIIATPTRNVFSPYIHSLLIARAGKLVVEEYFYGFDVARAHDSRSLGKTFAAVLVGAAQQQGVRLTPDTRVLPFFQDYGATKHPDPRKQNLQLRHFMTMTSGLACDDNDDNSPGNEDAMQEQEYEPDYWRFHLDLPMVQEPGVHYAYCSGTTNLVTGVVERASGVWLPDFFYQRIAQPMQFGTYHMQMTPTLTGYFGGGIYMTPRDMLKLGQLWLHRGEWNGVRVVPRAWTELSVREDSLVKAPGEGYHWHLLKLKTGGREWFGYEGNGNGGQYVIVVPELDLVVGFTAGNYRNYGTWRRFRDELVTLFVIPAAATTNVR